MTRATLESHRNHIEQAHADGLNRGKMKPHLSSDEELTQAWDTVGAGDINTHVRESLTKRNENVLL